jgi:hypothetical protein
MNLTTMRKQNLDHLIELAGTYKGLSRKKLAEFLGRDPTKISSETGNPKLDYLVRLAEVLDWSVGDIARIIWEDPVPRSEGTPPADFEGANAAARAAHRAGDYRQMLGLAGAMADLASTPEQRAIAALRESGAWDGMGRYTKQVEAVRRGLQQSPITTDLRLLLRTNLANTYYTLGHMLEARAMARDLIDDLSPQRPTSRSARAAEAFAYYVHGHASRCLMTQEPDRGPHFARTAIDSLQRSISLYIPLADEFNHEPWRGIAQTCRGGIIEAEVELGVREPMDAIRELLRGLDSVAEGADGLVGDRLECYGWWCIFGCDIALRHLSGAELQRQMAVFTNMGYEIADRLDNWAMRERLFTLEFIRRKRLDELAGLPIEWTIDDEEVRVIVGTMGRFPLFMNTGWKILQSATVIGGQ